MRRVVSDFEEFHAVILDFGAETIIYRGVTDVSYQLIPKIGRYKKFNVANVETAEKRILNIFKQQSLPYLDHTPTNDWESR